MQKLKAPPKIMPTEINDLYAFLSYPNYYEGESEDDHTSRVNIFNDFKQKLDDSGMTLQELSAVKAGILVPPSKNGASPLINSLIQKL
jgi:hypothetical protein